ncbi:VaFE repeat-containing surface-anchored protein [Adlercreutzia sp. ZJ473]|uniref:VaFE repeat-containing surface-anchored protein n=1 Tax=Adlercreutzia sp. ZJ473 TaxID=2722822 RepID=UPI001554514A|nr:VaFE repeat-containing surface-anchored protein [Adlercreutzia sp. ZJ473]
MQAAQRQTASRAMRLFMALAIAAGLIPLTSFACSRQAYADTSWLSVGRNVYYDNYNTTRFSDGNGWTAYCAQPSKPTPASGAYQKLSLRDVYEGVSSVESPTAVLYFGYGGPGFDPAMWPSTWYDGSPMTDDDYYAITHILVADRMYGDAEAALTGCSTAFRQYYGYFCQGQEWWVRYVSMGESANPDGTYLRMIAAWQALPGSARKAYVDSCYALRTGKTQNIVVTCPHKPTGSLELQKTSTNPSLTEGNACYSLAGATYGVYRDSACASEAATITTNADGGARAEGLAVGTYYVREKAPSEGYALDSATHEVRISGGQTTRLDVGEIPQSSPADLWLAKADLETRASLSQGAATLENAQFSVRYFDGYYNTPAQAEASGALTATWLVSTDESGRAPLGNARTSSGKSLPRNSRGQAAIPLGTVLIQEVKAPEGYLANDGEVIVRHVTSEGIGEDVRTYRAPTVSEQAIRGGVSVEKRDAESRLLTPLGAASIDGTTFAVTNKSARAVYVNGTWREPGEVVATIVAHGGVAATAADALPYGTYAVKEMAAGTGYLPTDQAERTFAIRDEGAIVALGASGSSDGAAYDQVKRGDLEFVKTRESDQKRLSGIPFKITSQTTGEWHVIVTDDNGEAKTSAAWNAHATRANANDAALNADGTVDEAKLDASAGVWFGLTSTGSLTKADDSLSALPYDVYTVEELPVAANEHLELVELADVAIARDGYSVNLGTLDDQSAGEVSISTAARDALDGDKVLLGAADARVIDRVAYGGLTAGKPYVLTGTLMDKATGEAVLDADGQPVTASRELTPEKTTGYAELAFTFDALALGGRDLVCFEQIAAAEAPGTAIAAHEDLDDYEQTIRVEAPAISTKAVDMQDGDGTASADVDAAIIDTVSYRNLVADGRAYVLRGTLMDKGTGSAYLDADGNEATAQVEFTPEEPSGTVEVAFAFNAAGQGGAQVVGFEELRQGERVLATHADLENAAQTIELESPAVSTTAADAADGDHLVCADPESSVIDTVAYEGLVPGKEYVACGTLMAAGEGAGDTPDVSGSPEVTPLLDASGAPVVGSTAFTPEAPSGTVEVAFDFDSTGLSGRCLVAFEKLTRNGVEVASHEDPADERQRVEVVAPRLETEATDAADFDHEIAAKGEAAVVDAVTYENLVPGKEYRLRGTVMDKDAGKELAVSGRIVQEELSFIPEEPSGVISLTFAFDASDLAGKTLVAFEKLSREGEVVAEHADLESESQTVSAGSAEEGHEAAVASPPPPGSLPRTGDSSRPFQLAAALAAVAGVTLVAARIRSRRQR